MITGPWMVLGCLCAVVQAQVFSKALVTQIVEKAVTAPADDGEGFSSDMSWVIYGIPTVKWSIDGWVFVETAADTARLMQVHTSANKDVYLYWPTNAPPTVNDGSTDHPSTGSPSRVNGKWFHAILAGVQSSLFAVVTERGTATQYEIDVSVENELNAASTFMGPVGDSTFVVRTT